MTLDISAIRQRIEKATPGEWKLFQPEVKNDCVFVLSDNDFAICEMWIGDGGDPARLEEVLANSQLFVNAKSDLRTLCDEVERLRAELNPVFHCEACNFDYHAKIVRRETIPCPTCKAPATMISVPADESPKEEGK